MTTLIFIHTYWKAIVGGILLVILIMLGLALLTTRAALADRTTERDRARQALADQITSYQTAARQAQAEARAVEIRNQQIQQEAQNAIEAQLADARARAADYARRLSGAAAPTDPDRGGGRMPEATDAAGGADRARAQAILADDLSICSENTVKAAGWREWWKQLGSGR